jgi:nitrite reductase/ring-hydroxylating ferredoxin subunit/uncharacterized membrane protein
MAEPWVDRWIRSQSWMDRCAGGIQGAVGAAYRVLGRPGRVLEDVMHGTKLLGHPLHPAITDIPIGAWAAGLVADVVAHYTDRLPTQAGDIALAVGLAIAVPAAVTGYTDFRHTFGHERRVALVHGLAMSVVVVLEAVSLGLRSWSGPGAHAAAVGFATAAFALLLAGAYLGGHLVFGLGTAVNRNAFTEATTDLVVVGTALDFPEGVLRRVDAAGMPALVVRTGGKLRAIGAVCSHAGGPLDEGTLDGDTVTCPWHGSRFCLTDGRVTTGPATFGQPVFAVHEVDGGVALKAAGAVQ